LIFHNSPHESESVHSISILQLSTYCYSCEFVPKLAVLSSFKVSLFLDGRTECITSFSKISCLLLRFQICFGLSVSNFHCHIKKFVIDKTQTLLVFKQLVHTFSAGLERLNDRVISIIQELWVTEFSLSSSLLFSYSLPCLNFRRASLPSGLKGWTTTEPLVKITTVTQREDVSSRFDTRVSWDVPRKSPVCSVILQQFLPGGTEHGME
jgi:hypothetical protein